MIKKTIGIATILLLILVIALVVGIGSAKASTGLVQLQAHGLPAAELNQLVNLHSELLLSSLHLDSTVGDLEQGNLPSALARGVSHFDALPAVLQQDLALGKTVYTLGSLGSLSDHAV